MALVHAAYDDPDTIVTDEPTTTLYKRSRSPTVDLDVRQVHRDNGKWCRPILSDTRTACDGEFIRHGSSTRRYTLASPDLCRNGCWAEWELAESDRINAEHRADFIERNKP